MPSVVTKDYLDNLYNDVDRPVGPVRFQLPSALSSLSDETEDPLLSAGSRLAIIQLEEDPAGLSLLVRLAVSCAEEGAKVLFVSRLIDMEKFADLALAFLSPRGEGFPPDRLVLNKLASLNLAFHEASRSDSLGADTLGWLIESSGCDLLLLDSLVGPEGRALSEAAYAMQVPVVYCCGASYRDRCIWAEGDIGSPTHMLLLDRSLDEEEAERDDRPNMGLRECRLVAPNKNRGSLELPFKGTFRLTYLEDGRIADCIDECGGHILCSEIEAVVIEGCRLTIEKPLFYDRRIELLYGIN